jgi:hypothetical protein
MTSSRSRYLFASLGLLVLAWPAGVLAATSAASVYNLSISPADLRLQGRGVAALRASAGQTEPPLSIAFERSGGSPGLPTLQATLLTGSCSPDSQQRDGCDRATLDFATGHLEFRSFSRRKGIAADLQGLPSVWDSALRVTSRPTKAEPRLALLIQAPSAANRITFEARVADREYSLAIDSPMRRNPASLVPLLALLHQVVDAESGSTGIAGAVPRTSGERGTEKPPGGPGTDDRVCDLCDFCSDLPGGQTLGGCLGDGGGGGGFGGGFTPPPPPPPPPPSPCTITTEQALEVLSDVLFFELPALSLCKSSLSSISITYTKLFDNEAKNFKAKRDGFADPPSKSCANCFFQVTRRFGTAGTGIVALKSILSRKCIRDYSKLSDPANAGELGAVVGLGQSYLNDLATCKKSCDPLPPTPPPPHRAYCDCLADYLSWELTGPRPGAATCPR